MSIPKIKKLPRFFKSKIKKFLRFFKSDNRVAHDYWKSRKNWKLSVIKPTAYNNQKAFLINKYIPLLDKNFVICDYGCATGEWSFLVGPHVKNIEAYDISPDMIKQAKRDAMSQNINNVSFDTSDARSFSFRSTYDSMMILGLFTCILDDNYCTNFIKKISDAINPSGYIVIKDTVSLHEDIVYKESDYVAIYRNREKYLNFYINNGFRIIEQEYLYQNKVDKIGSIITIFQKQ